MHKPQPLSQTREQITALDGELLALLAKRRQLSLEVARSKEVDVRPIRDTQREKELLARLVQQGRERGLDAHLVISLYQSIIEDSVLSQQAYLHGRANPDTLKQQYGIAYLGARGSYSYLAASRYCQRRQVEMLDFGCKNFDEIVQAVESGHADYGFLPIENTSSGSINEVYDVLQHTSLSIVGETTIEVSHCLLARPGTRKEDITTVFAHPQPISQCSRFLSKHPEIKLEYCSSTAEAMEKVQSSKEAGSAAIGSIEGGALYQLDAVEKDLANQKINQSRFIVVARKAVAVPEQLPAKCTLIMATGQKTGALVDALLVLKDHNINMSKLESRPIPGTPWEEMFYLDVDANLASAEMQAALRELERSTRFIKVLGCYPCETVKPTQLSNSQLLLEPDSSVSTTIAQAQACVSQQNQHAENKQGNSDIMCGQLHLGAGHFGALVQTGLPDDPSLAEHDARALKDAGFQAVILEGLGRMAEPGILGQYAKALQSFKLVCIVRVEQESELELGCQHGDMLLIAGKQMFNPDLLRRAGALPTPVILERNPQASLDELLSAAHSIRSAGNQQVALCDAGIKAPSHDGRPVLDLTSLVTLKHTSPFPLLINPSTCIEVQELGPQCRAIKTLGADGLVLSLDSKQQPQTLPRFKALLTELYR
jgi:chorismate mutase / prephenate dehydratase